MNKLYSLLVLFCCCVCPALAQVGTITGQLTDYASNKPLAGARVVLEFSVLSASTDGSGKFTLKNVPVGTHTIVISANGYDTRKIDNLVVEANRATQVNLTMKTNMVKMLRKNPKAKKPEDTEISVVRDIKASESITSGISAEQIYKAQDIDAGYAVKRMNGVTLLEDRFALIRGLSERYNTVMVNGSIPTSMEVDSRAFSFDVLPSTIVERIMLYKSPSAELPGEFAGGVLKVQTMDVPTQNKIYFGAGLSYRNMTTFTDYQMNVGSPTDQLGFDNGTRALPGNFPDRIDPNRTREEAREWRLPNNWKETKVSAAPDMRLYLGLARSWKLGNMTLANLTNGSYSYQYQYYTAVRARYYPGRVNDTLVRFTDQVGTLTSRFGLVHNWALMIDSRNRIEFKQLVHSVGTSQRVRRSGYDLEANVTNPLDSGYTLTSRSYRWEQKKYYNGTLAGQHTVSENLKANWLFGYGKSWRDEPDWKRSFDVGSRGNSVPPVGGYPTIPNINSNSHFFSKLSESNFTQAADLEYIINPYKAEEEQDKLKFGFYSEQRLRDSRARWFSYKRSTDPRFNNFLTGRDLSIRFDPANVNDTTGFILQEGTRPTDAYVAKNRLTALYVSYLTRITTRSQLYGGVRYETNRQLLEAPITSDSTLTVDRPEAVVLPSLNYTYYLTGISQVRLAYGMTVNRPILRELAPYTYNDYDYFITITGNPELRNAKIHNLDLRYEYYPNRGEYIAVGAFYKRFERPIERVITSGIVEQKFSYINARYANSAGFEIEVRKTFAGITRNVTWLDRTYFQGGLTVAFSRVVLPEINTLPNIDTKRPLMGQAPYMLNAGIFNDDKDKLSHFNIMYSVIGPRVFSVGDQLSPTQYEMPRHIFDFNMTKFIASNWEARLTVHDLLNQPYVIRQDSDRDGIVTRQDKLISRYRKGTWVTVGITYKILN